jgi:hypothetical protein
MRLTPATLAACYEFLRTTPPFHRWRLPPSEQIAFRIGRETRVRGWHQFGGTHRLSVSEATIVHNASLVAAMAHEMIHVYQAANRLETRGQHNADFRRRARAVCRQHGFDPGLF